MLKTRSGLPKHCSWNEDQHGRKRVRFRKAGFSTYLAHFGSYNKTYGTLGAVITFLVWLWFTNIAIRVGAQIDAEIERERELDAGIDAHERIQLPVRDSS